MKREILAIILMVSMTCIVPTYAKDTSENVNELGTNTKVPEPNAVQWEGNKIVSRVLPYTDFISLFIRLPIAHAAATGRGVKVAIIQLSGSDTVSTVIKQIAPDSRTELRTLESYTNKEIQMGQETSKAGFRAAIIPDVQMWSEQSVIPLVKQLLADEVVVIIPSDLSEDSAKIKIVNTLHSMGVLTVGRVGRQSLVIDTEQPDGGKRPFNTHIREIQTDLFSTIGVGSSESPTNPSATAAGVASLVLEKWPKLSSVEVRNKITAGARRVWQTTSIETGQWLLPIKIDPITTKYTPNDENAIFCFRVLDAAGALEVDTKIPWFLNMLNCQKAWEITKGQGVVVLVTDSGFHIRHPELKGKIKATKHFGPQTFDNPDQQFHGTEMSRILLSIAPDVEIIPVLCSGWDSGNDVWAQNIAKSFIYAAEQKVDVVTSSWGFWCKDYENLLSAVRNAVDSGIVVSWFHYPRAYPGLLRSCVTYSMVEEKPCIGFADRFLTDPPGFRPVEVEAGLSGTAPQAAAIAALAKSVNSKLTPIEIEKLIFENSTPIGNNIVIPDAYKIVLAAKNHSK